MKEEPKPGVADWIAKNLWAILAIIGGAAQGYNVGTSTMADMKDRIKAMEARQNTRRPFMGEASQRIEYLCNRDKECAARFDPMNVPE